MPIHFHTETISFHLKEKRKLKKWIEAAILSYKKTAGEINYIFCSDEYLFQLNKKYLHHNTYTDIITFDNSEKNGEIAGDIFISIERVKENASNPRFQSGDAGFEEELHRVIIHGILHLLGFNDKSDKEKKKIRKLENYWLQKFI